MNNVYPFPSRSARVLPPGSVQWTDPYWERQDRKARRRRFAHQLFVAVVCSVIAVVVAAGFLVAAVRIAPILFAPHAPLAAERPVAP